MKDDNNETEEKYDADIYRVRVRRDSGVISVIGVRYQCLDVCFVSEVHPPTWIEQMFGRTIESKVDRAKARAQRMCDKLNNELEQCIEFCKTFKGDE